MICLYLGLLLIVLDSLFVSLEDKLAKTDITSIVVCFVVFVKVIVTIIALSTQPSSLKGYHSGISL